MFNKIRGAFKLASNRKVGEALCLLGKHQWTEHLHFSTGWYTIRCNRPWCTVVRYRGWGMKMRKIR